jgi:carboxylate-amine ligase
VPRTWLPPSFVDESDYHRFVDTLVRSRAIEDASFLWCVVRPSAKHPTLKLRIADSCTRLDDTLAIAALYRCLVRRLHRDKDLNRGMTGASHAIVAENCWRAQRYGIHGSFVDEATRTAKPVRDVLSETLALLREDTRALGCELDLCRWILAYGTSADRQLAVYTEAVGRAARTGTPSSPWWTRSRPRRRARGAQHSGRHDGPLLPSGRGLSRARRTRPPCDRSGRVEVSHVPLGIAQHPRY